MDIMEIRDIIQVMDIMDIMDIMNIMEIIDIMMVGNGWCRFCPCFTFSSSISKLLSSP